MQFLSASKLSSPRQNDSGEDERALAHWAARILPLLLSPLLPLASQPANYPEACAQPTAKHLGLHGHAGPVNGFEAGTLFIEVDAVATEAVSSKMLGPAAAAPEPAAAVAGFDPEPTCAAAASQPTAVGPQLSSATSKLSADLKPLAAPAEATKAGAVGANCVRLTQAAPAEAHGSLEAWCDPGLPE